MANELEIREMARKLNLYNIARLETYQTDLSPVDYLSFLLQYEIDERKRRSVENNRRLSRLPKSNNILALKYFLFKLSFRFLQYRHLVAPWVNYSKVRSNHIRELASSHIFRGVLAHRAKCPH